MIPHDPRHLGVPSSASKMISEPRVRSTQTEHLSCINISTVSKWTELSVEAHHLGVPLGASKIISQPMVRLTQTMHLYCTDTKIVSKQKEARFHMTHITLEFNRVHQKWFLGLWYIRRKPCIYLASRLALSQNRPSFHLMLNTYEYHQLRSKWFSELMVHLAQTAHLSCIDTNSVSKQKDEGFHMTHVT
jgi:hypothetical protein